MKQTLIFWPMIAHAFLVFALYMELGRRRYKAGKNRDIHVRDFRHLKPESDTTYTGVAARAVVNNFEMPVLFHAASLTLYAAQAVSSTALIIAWIFIVARIAQAWILLTYNNVFHRGGAFFASVFATMGLWIVLAFHLLSVN